MPDVPYTPPPGFMINELCIEKIRLRVRKYPGGPTIVVLPCVTNPTECVCDEDGDGVPDPPPGSGGGGEA